MKSGIEALKVLSTLQAASAAEEAGSAAEKGRELLIVQKNLRAKQQYFERAVGDKTLTEQEYANLNQMIQEFNQVSGEKGAGASMSNFGVNYGNDGILGHGAQGSWSAKLDSGSENKNERDNANKVETMRKNFESALKELESQERLDNFRIQELMSRYNQSEQLASSVEKKSSETESAIIRNVAG